MIYYVGGKAEEWIKMGDGWGNWWQQVMNENGK